MLFKLPTLNRYLPLIAALLWLPLTTRAQNTAHTVVSGVVLDARSESPLPYVTVQFGDGLVGVRTDIHGRFWLESPDKQSTVKISYLGFASQRIEIRPGELNEIKVLMQEIDKQLLEVTIRPEKYKKNNPAVDLIEQVFQHKDQNRKEGLDYYRFEKHERLRFDLNGITDKFKNKWYFKKFQFVFGFCDTSQVNQKVALPFYLRERMLETYYRRNPTAKKERLLAERQTAFEDEYDVDKDGVSAYLNSMYTEVDIYEPTITLLDKQFIGPLSGTATSFYRFYITDTVQIDGKRFADVFFSPKNKNDLAFMGNMLVALDSTYAVRRVEMGISKDINLNWVADLRIEQDFTFQGSGTSRRLLLDKDVVILDMKIWKNKDGRSLLATKTNTYRDYQLNQPLPDSIFNGKKELLRDTGQLDQRPDAYWVQRRHNALTPKESDVGVMIDSVKHTRIYKNLVKAGVFFGTGYQRVGKIEIGELSNFYSFNDVEGTRLRLSLRTNDRYFKKMRLDGYTAYGFKDLTWKFGSSATFAFKGAQPRRFPANQIRFSYVQDLYYPGLGTNSTANLISSVQRGSTDRLLLNRIVRTEYTKEFRQGISYSVNIQRKAVSGAGALIATPDPGQPAQYADVVTTESGAWMRYAPNERFYQGRNQRVQLISRWPVFLLQYKAGFKGVWGGDYAYQRASLRMDKRLYLGFLGKSKLGIEAGRIFGQVSYPFLEIHRANQSYFFDDYGFNLMNYFEFISDRYAMLHLNHNFGGILFNRIPLVKKLHWREGATLKVLYGGLGSRNIPTATNGLLPFPVDAQQRPLTRGLGRMPYIEASAGIGNLFNILRVDCVWRLSYRDAPQVNTWGIRLMLNGDF